jgi:hypothetical protein
MRRSALVLTVLAVCAVRHVVGAQQGAVRGGEFAGRVQCDGEPVRGALVRWLGPNMGFTPQAISDERGAFRLAELPAGAGQVEVSKPGWVRPLPEIPPTRVDQDPNVFTLCRGGVISGVVRDLSGAPTVDVAVMAINVSEPKGNEPLRAVTDRSGIYRLYGLRPGAYWVVASPHYVGTQGVALMRERWVDDKLRQLGLTSGAPTAPPAPLEVRALRPTYYSRAVEPDPISIRVGDIITGIDLTIGPVPVGSIRGRVVHAGAVGFRWTLAVKSNRPNLPLELRLGLDDPFFERPQLREDGSFVYERVPFGRMALVAIGGSPDARGVITPVSVQWSAVDINVEGDLENITFVMRPAYHISGRVVDQDGRPYDLAAGRIRVFLERDVDRVDVNDPTFKGILSPATEVSAEGAFDLAGVIPGEYTLTVSRSDGRSPTLASGGRPAETVMVSLPVSVVDGDQRGLLLRYREPLRSPPQIH